VPTVTIPIDMNNPHKTQKPFKVYSAVMMRGTGERHGEYYKGYIIVMEVDPRDLKFNFQASVLNDTTIVVTAPALDYHETGGDAAADTQAITDKANPRRDNDVIYEALVHARNEFKTKIQDLSLTNQMTYHLKFKDGTMLSSEALECNENERDKMAVEALNVVVDMSDIIADAWALDEHGTRMVEDGHLVKLRHMIYKGCLIWRVADKAHGTRKHDAGARDTAPSDAFTAMFGNLNVGG
jgi:hypothetical protein